MQVIDVAKWIKENYTPYEGDDSFLVTEASKNTKEVWDKCCELRAEEIKTSGCLDVDNKTISTVNSHEAGYIIKEKEDIVGLQTDAPLKRSIKPFGGVRVVKNALKAYDREIDPSVEEVFKYRKTHNDCVFDLYTPEMRKARSNAILTGLPDGYGRGRIIGDYRRVALYGVDQLIEWKQQDKLSLGIEMSEESMRTREEVADQIKALNELKALAQRYGCDVSKPATTAKEAIQATYFGYLASVKDQDGAAMSFGRVDCFFDVYIENDIKKGLLTEAEAQDLIDQLIIKLRLVRHLRTPEYNDLFAGDPTWVTMTVGGMTKEGKPLVSKTSYRILNTLVTLGAAPEPNITVLWNNKLPTTFKHYCNKISIQTSSIQYENDNLMNDMYGDDYSIACCVSQMRLGKDMQFFGARCNLAKLLLYAFNHGYDERTEKQVGPDFGDIKLNEDGSVNFESAWEIYDKAMDWIACLYVNTMNAIHYSHDKYCYEAIQMALHDTNVHRYMAFGIAGFSVIVDSFAAIKYAKVFPVRNPETGLTTDFKIEGDFPKFGNDDERVDNFAVEIPKIFLAKLKKYPAYRNAEHTLSILTITSNVVYGKKTGTTPDGRKAGEAFAPGCNPMHGRETNGAVASLNSVSKVEYAYCKDGISNTFTFVPTVLGKIDNERVANLSGLLDGYFSQGGFHLNVNVLVRETLKDAMVHPELYPNLTIRVSGYAVHFIRLTPDQQREVIARTFHETL
ncbi:formate acetyltransferase [Piromyces finnis]|uniref:formate C-acetyltransferase n=1 Tax=Piromyces finnis TaxID=1754191 RepID=A0A1Y1V2L1_9FUNG|nr:formate acetyltransferase [Piromyces finnis]|eukprot:ORX45927.1 formate acetyltransferase [Piromyces finnis]